MVRSPDDENKGKIRMLHNSTATIVLAFYKQQSTKPIAFRGVTETNQYALTENSSIPLKLCSVWA